MKILTGKVLHTKLAKTAKVEVSRIVKHPIYNKRMTKTKKYLVHDELGSKDGDMVKFVDCAPISKTKKWKVIEIIKK